MYSTPYSRHIIESPIREISLANASPLLPHIPDPPKKLFAVGSLLAPSDGEYKYLTVVGSRKYSGYARQACESLIAGLRGLPVVIVSGLALGIDSIAHEAAMKNGLRTIAVPGSGLGERALYPPTHLGLAAAILENGGALISPFDRDTVGAPWTFPVRNRIMAGMSHATLVVEADIKSGTLITSGFAGDFNRDVLAVPGSIFSSQSEGPHMLIRKGATPITCPDDLREALGFERSDSADAAGDADAGGDTGSSGNAGASNVDKNVVNKKTLYDIDMSPVEKSIVEVLSSEISLDRERLFEILINKYRADGKDLNAGEINVAISLLEIKDLIKNINGDFKLTK